MHTHRAGFFRLVTRQPKQALVLKLGGGKYRRPWLIKEGSHLIVEGTDSQPVKPTNTVYQVQSTSTLTNCPLDMPNRHPATQEEATGVLGQR